MRIAVYGATGMIGSRVVAEAKARGHEVTGISRSGGDGIRRGDAGDAGFAKQVAGEVDVVVSAIGPSRTGAPRRDYLTQLRTLAETLGDARLLVIGGAGSLLVGGTRLVDLPDFPEEYKAEALVAAEALDYVRGLGDEVDWTFVSPAPLIQPGERTGRYTLGTDSPAGDSVSAEDFAVALLDEIEKPAHVRSRFTLAS
ncbi:NAD(P)-dependent oxidoreductase [Amycolatopsis suaedae]|uniref:NAD-dependent epimerase/dehydratase family protein n=1 Tax=Amycolatopsis suaedae TaxID=2510978 RepID=A0A4Q7J7A8_9PSEU|nr:NAD(P)H-binding protein [Amycolatopsis suaedae]RZQ63057.1 NAD-dependent epimerase/dehydratase family protein [Amycolatopsis suaedae]